MNEIRFYIVEASVYIVENDNCGVFLVIYLVNYDDHSRSVFKNNQKTGALFRRNYARLHETDVTSCVLVFSFGLSLIGINIPKS